MKFATNCTVRKNFRVARKKENFQDENVETRRIFPIASTRFLIHSPPFLSVTLVLVFKMLRLQLEENNKQKHTVGTVSSISIAVATYRGP